MTESENNQADPADIGPETLEDSALLHCPIRGPLNASALAADGLTPSEEARRIDFIDYLLEREYPATHIAVETVVLTGLGEKGRNKLRADVIVYDVETATVKSLTMEKRIERAQIVAEIKRDSSSKKSGISCQLEPAMRLLPSMRVLGAYWDDVNRLLFSKELQKKDGDSFLVIKQDALANLPDYGQLYQHKPITVDTLTSADNLVAVLFNLANVMRSHGINDEQVRYKETVKLLLARYCDETAATAAADKKLSLQVLEGPDPEFMERVGATYEVASRRYSRAKSLFEPTARSELDEDTLRDVVESIQGINFSSASNDAMQQVFMSFVPTVFKKNLDQYFTPLTLIETIVEMTSIGPNDKVADPAMGTADFLTAAMADCSSRGQTDISQRVFGIDSDPNAFELAVINMILNRDGQANLECRDSIQEHALWANEIGVVLCNPPFGARTVERRKKVLEHYELAHAWRYDGEEKKWVVTSKVVESQQLGILFIERCYKMLADGGRLGIIVPEGFLCTASYGYLRQWLLEKLVIRGVVELPRRIFLKSDADLRSNILIAERVSPTELANAQKTDYRIFSGLVRKVGYKLGKGYGPIPVREPATGLEVRDDANKLILDSDFRRVRRKFRACHDTADERYETEWNGARFSDVIAHPSLDLKPRRLAPLALQNVERIRSGTNVTLGDIAEVVEDFVDILKDLGPSMSRRLVEGQDIRAIEGTVMPQEPARCWEIANRKGAKQCPLKYHDIIVGLVRPERRNIGLFMDGKDDVIGSPDGVAVVRAADTDGEYPLGWIYASLRSEACRLQFWTESGGTSYGKLTRDQIRNVVLPVPDKEERQAIHEKVLGWSEHIEDAHGQWTSIGSERDRKPILNSPLFGLVED